MARVMALTLAITAVVATLVASVLPLGLARLGADPALPADLSSRCCKLS
jgi:Mg/Co/Ni transporter MgtE